MTTVAFIGLGIMGGPMAGNLVKAGFDVIGYNRSPQPIRSTVQLCRRRSTSVMRRTPRRRLPAIERRARCHLTTFRRRRLIQE